jgi:uncharacterized membrane protein (DUF373 family)
MDSELRKWLQQFNPSLAYNAVVELILKVMAPLVILVLIIALVGVFRDLWEFLRQGTSEKSFPSLLGSILSIFVLIELFRSIVEYFEHHRIKIHLIAEAALVFLLREAMIGVYQDKLDSGKMIALAILILVVGAVRVGAMIYSPDRFCAKQ